MNRTMEGKVIRAGLGAKSRLVGQDVIWFTQY